ncbi:MAG TPA: dihydrofolate reductase family protein [Puia sp.]|nr:dihydrofolate reductase family protein [Puia sp.]
MRQLILKISVSVDGFVGTTKGDVRWIFDSMDDAVVQWIVDVVSNADYHLMGSHTFHDMASYWPTSTEPFAAPMNNIPKIAFSKKGITNIGDPANTTMALKLKVTSELRRAQGQPLAETPAMASWTNARIESDLVGTITRLKKESGKPLMAHGGAGFVQSLIAADLIDEYNLLIHPTALGAGLPLFPPLDKPKDLNLVKTITFKTGAVAHTYRPA